MSVKFSGNTISKFGSLLPTLYFEKIKLYDDQVVVQVAMYVQGRVDEPETFQIYANDVLNDLHYYVMFVADGEVSPYWNMVPAGANHFYPPDEVGPEGTGRLQKLIEGKKTVLDLVRTPHNPALRMDFYEAPDSPGGDWELHGSIPTATDFFVNTPSPKSGMEETTVWETGMIGVDSLDIPPDTQMGWGIPYPVFTNVATNYYKFSYQDFSDVPELLYNNDGSPIYKYVANLTLNTDEDPSAGASMQEFIYSWHRIAKLSMVAFTTSAEIDIGGQGGEDADHTWLQAATSNKGIAHFYNTLTSDITYEKITDWGVLNTETISTYVLPNQEEYGEIPVQAIDSIYYTAGQITLEDIYNNFKIFVGSGLSGNSQIQDIYDTINYILEIYRGKEELLPRLNVLRKTFPDTSTATEVGRLYESFKILLYNTNNAVMRGTPLVKKLIKSSAVVDYRAGTPVEWNFDAGAGWEGDAGSEAMIKNFIPMSLAKINKYSIYAAAQSQLATAGLAKNNIYIGGYWFFDYERAIRKSSEITRYFSYDKIEEHFGRRAMQEYFTIRSAWQGRYRILDNTEDYYTGTSGERLRSWEFSCEEHSDLGQPNPERHGGHDTDFHATQPGGRVPVMISNNKALFDVDGSQGQPGVVTEYPQIYANDLTIVEDYQTTYGGGTWNQITYASPSDIAGYLSATETNFAGDTLSAFAVESGQTDYTYSIIRNFDFVNKLEIDGHPYRLMCFEFQDLIKGQATDYDYEPTFNDFLNFSVGLNDSTLRLFAILVQSYKDMYLALQGYVKEATQFCSYNNIDGKFNRFFENAQNDKYEEDPEMAPWIYGPIVYYYHVDMLTDAYNGNEDSIIAAAIRESQRINPDTGTLEYLMDFASKVQSLYEINYSSTHAGSLAEGLELESGPESVPTTYKIYGGYGKSYYPLPELKSDIPLGSTYHEPLADAESGVAVQGTWPPQEEIEMLTFTLVMHQVKMVKMGFGFKKIPKGSSGQYDHTSDGWIRITPVGASQKLPNGENATASTAARIGQVINKQGRDRETSDGLYLYNSHWDYDMREGPNSDRYRTVWLYPGIEYNVTWFARDDNNINKNGWPLVNQTVKIKVPQWNPAGEYVIPVPGASNTELNAHERSDTGYEGFENQADLSKHRYNIYILRCNNQNSPNAFNPSGNRRGLFGKNISSWYDHDESITENSTHKDYNNFYGYK